MTHTLLLVSKFGIVKTGKAWKTLLMKGVVSCFGSEASPTNPASWRNSLLSGVASSALELQEGQLDGVYTEDRRGSGKIRRRGGC